MEFESLHTHKIMVECITIPIILSAKNETICEAQKCTHVQHYTSYFALSDIIYLLKNVDYLKTVLAAAF